MKADKTSRLVSFLSEGLKNIPRRFSFLTNNSLKITLFSPIKRHNLVMMERPACDINKFINQLKEESKKKGIKVRELV